MSSERRCKVERAVERYDIGPQHDRFRDIHDELLALWKGLDNQEPLGYRRLADRFNRQLLRSVYEANDRLTLGSRLEDEFETMTGDDDIARGELFDELEQQGIDARQLREDMVSFSTIRRHLTECLDGEKEPIEAQTDWEQNSIEIASERLLEKVEKALMSYETKDRIEGAMSADVSVQIQLSCPDCPTRRSLNEALQHGYVCEDHLGQDTH